MGSAPANLAVLPKARVEGTDQPVADILTHLPQVNVPPFAMCRSLSNPQVAAATAAANGVPTPSGASRVPVVPNGYRHVGRRRESHRRGGLDPDGRDVDRIEAGRVRPGPYTAPSPSREEPSPGSGAPVTRQLVVATTFLLMGSPRSPSATHGSAPTIQPAASAAGVATSPTASSSTTEDDHEPSWALPKPKLKPEPSVCKKGVVTECEFWRAALRQTLRLDPPCAEDDPNFRYPWGADGVKLRRLKIQYPGATSCDIDLSDSITVRCYFPLRSPSENATTRARRLADSFNECVSEEFATKMVVHGNDDLWLSVYLAPVPDEFPGLTATWQNQTPAGKAGTDQLKIYNFNAVWLQPKAKLAPSASVPALTPSEKPKAP